MKKDRSAHFLGNDWPFHMTGEGEVHFEAWSQDEIERAGAEFRHTDRDGNGHLDENELRQYLSTGKRLPLRCFPKLIIRIFGSDGTITFDQFCAFYKALVADPNSDEFLGKKIFDAIDTNHNGVIEADECAEVIGLIETPGGSSPNEGTLSQMDYPQFKAYFYRKLKMIWLSHGGH